jgi:UDP-N-acetylglucosamine--N-acetylmuramyl-(pentapeptide) pyrophosphoryl-undecaprenol N-acetylglucosamine transferase
MRIVVSGGGTAGHITPILATSDALKSLDNSVEILYIGQADSMEARIALASGFKFAAIKAGKFRRLTDASVANKLLNPSTLGLNARDAGRVIAGIAGSISILRKFKPDVVFVKGGFVGLPVGIAAKMLRIPLVIHESDVSPGLTNRTLGRWAKVIAVGFPEKNYHDFDPKKLFYTGNLVRTELLNAHRLAGLAAFKLSPDLPVVLVTGGSLGAQAINNAILSALPELVQFCQIIHLTGENELPRIEFELRQHARFEHRDRYHPYAFLMSEMANALAAADLVVARAGANTIAEMAALAKPTILIPNYLMAGHQVDNARMLARLGAVRVLDEATLTQPKLVGEIQRVLGSETEQEALSKAIYQFATVDAPVKLAEAILQVGKGTDRT